MSIEAIDERQRVGLRGYVSFLEKTIVPSTRKQSEVYNLLKSALNAKGMRQILAAAAAHNHSLHGQLTSRFLCSHDCRGKGILLPADSKSKSVAV